MSEQGERKNSLQETAGGRKGYVKRLFMARTGNESFEGVPYRAEQELGWNRATLKKGLHNTTAANFLISDSCQEAVVRSSVAASGNRGNEATNESR
ncbi:MAG: hypothetical protein GY811_06600 [Myxococcales bacterium]|nr:hypothetical protein [Myxococcales bacterium]